MGTPSRRCRCCAGCEAALALRTAQGGIVKDRCLGGLRLLCLSLAAFYFLVKRIVIDEGHLVLEDVLGIVETSLEAPVTGLHDGSALPYCTDGAGTQTGPSWTLPCVTGPDAWVAAPSAGNSELFIATHVKEWSSSGVAGREVFVQDPEAYTVGIAFTMEAPGLYAETREARYSRGSEGLATRLLGPGGEELPAALRRDGRADRVPLGALLCAAGLPDLDARRADSSLGESTRSTGALLVLDVDCQRGRSGDLAACSYTIRQIQQSEAKALVTSVSESQHGESLVQERRGIRIVVRCFGKMGQFRWSALVSAWITSLAMFWLVFLVVDAFFVRVASWKEQRRRGAGATTADKAVDLEASNEHLEVEAKTSCSCGRPASPFRRSGHATADADLAEAPTARLVERTAAARGPEGVECARMGESPGIDTALHIQDVALMLRPHADSHGLGSLREGKRLQETPTHMQSHDADAAECPPVCFDDRRPRRSFEGAEQARRRGGAADEAGMGGSAASSSRDPGGSSRQLGPRPSTPQSRVGSLLAQYYETASMQEWQGSPSGGREAGGGYRSEFGGEGSHTEEPVQRSPSRRARFPTTPQRGRPQERLGRNSRSSSHPARLRLPGNLLCGWACANSSASPPPSRFQSAAAVGMFS